MLPKAAPTPSCSWKSSWPSTTSIANGGVFDLELIRQQPGLVELKASGPKAIEDFANESGGHRWQRVPPTEKRGRVQTSTITVAVLPISQDREIRLNEKDYTWKSCRGSGAGGQHRNVTDSAIQLVHHPTGITIRCESERARKHNLRLAKEILLSKLKHRAKEANQVKRNTKRKGQVGSGMRGDKRRTIRIQADRVIDHLTGKSMSAKRYLRGELDALKAK